MTSTQDQLSALVDYLVSRRADILEAWRGAVGRDRDLTSGSGLSRTLFNDHIPEVLDSFGRRLLAWPSDIAEPTKRQESARTASHGLHRWQQGFRLREVTREWGYLQLCLADEIDRFAREIPGVEPAATVVALHLLMRLCTAGVSDSTEQYWQLQQADAAGHLRDLEQALATVKQLEDARAAGWREAAHDLRGSVTIVKTATTLLQGDASPEGPAEDTHSIAYEILEKGVTSLHEMLNNLTDLARIQAGQEQRVIAPFDAAALAGEFCTTMQPLAASSGLYIKCQGPSALPVEGDAIKVQRILQNLVLNALKYTLQGGIVIEWERSTETDCRRWMVSVQDTGPGFEGDAAIPATKFLADATRMAHDVEDDATAEGTSSNADEPAHTLASQSPQSPLREQTGEGIGLSIVKGLCDLLDATLELETARGHGSTFRVTFPVSYGS